MEGLHRSLSVVKVSNFGQEPMATVLVLWEKLLTNECYYHSRVNCVTSTRGDSRRKIRIRKPLKDQCRRGLAGLHLISKGDLTLLVLLMTAFVILRFQERIMGIIISW